MPTSRNWLRAGILVVTLLPLVLVGWISGITQAQPPGGPPRMGPNGPGGMPNRPGSPPGFPGSNPPNNPGNMPGGSNPNSPNIPGPPEMVWSCSNCGKEVGRCPVQPDIANCPFCGIRINNTLSGMAADSQDRNQSMNRNMNSPFPAGPAGSTSTPRSAITWIFAIMIFVVVVVIIAVAIGGAVLLFNSTSKPRRVRRSSRYRDEY